MKRATILLPLLASCGQVDNHSANRVILPASDAQELLKQCSRAAPAMGEKAWQPTPADVDAMEAALPSALAAMPRGREVDFSRLLDRWQRQYAGTIRGGRHYVYGSYFPVDRSNELAEWRKAPMRICDGGARFFGVEFDATARKITRIDFNGSFGG